MLQSGDVAPAFALASAAGRTIRSAELRGRRYVLYFYPRDDTPGCTTEACGFRDNLARLVRAGVDVFGVSKDSLASHARFRAKYALPFDLLSDHDNAVAKSFGAYGRKLMYGKPVTGTIRSTFLIDGRGRVERVWSPVKVAGHVDAVLAAARGEPEAPPSKGTRPTRVRASTPVRKRAPPKPPGGRPATRRKAAPKRSSPR